MVIDIKMKNPVAEFGHNGRLKFYVDLKKIYVDPNIEIHFSKIARYMWLKFCFEY